MNKKYLIALVATGFLGLAAILPLRAMAQETDGESTFWSRLADKLGIEQTQIQEAVTELHNEMHAEHQAEIAVKLADLVENGTITQRQADLLIAAGEIRPELRGEGLKETREEMQNLTAEERQARMEQHRAEMDQSIVDTLNEQGLNTSLAELQEAREAAHEAGIGPAQGRGFRGHGRML